MSPEPHGIVRALLRLQEEVGWLPPDRLEALAAELRVPLHRIESVSTFYTHFRRRPPAGPIVEVCRDLSCRLAGGESACRKLRALSEALALRWPLKMPSSAGAPSEDGGLRFNLRA